MTVLIGHAVGDENGNARGGLPGDQTGREVRVQDFYIRPGGWAIYMECTDADMAARAAAICRQICEDDDFGYDQGDRWTAYQAIKATGSIEAAYASELDCSSLIDIAYELAGLAIPHGYTGNLESRYLATGKFRAYKDAAHLQSSDYAKVGGLYLTPGKHVAMVLTDGPRSGNAPEPEPVETPVSSEADNPEPPYVLALRDTSIRQGPGKKYPKLSPNSILYTGQIAQLEEIAENGWYGVSTRYGLGFLSCRADLTKLVEG